MSTGDHICEYIICFTDQCYEPAQFICRKCGMTFCEACALEHQKEDSK